MIDSFNYRQDFQPRKGFWNQNVILIKEDDGGKGQEVILRSMAGYDGKNVGIELADYVYTEVVEPFILPVDMLSSTAVGVKTVRCALLAGSEPTHAVNTIATNIVDWDRILGDEDFWNGCLAVSGNAVLLKLRKDGRLTTFKRREALEIIMSTLSFTLRSDSWLQSATEKAYAEYCGRTSKKRKKKAKKTGK